MYRKSVNPSTTLPFNGLTEYCKPPTISPAWAYILSYLSNFWWAYRRGGLYTGDGEGLIHGRSFVSIINKSVINRKINIFLRAAVCKYRLEVCKMKKFKIFQLCQNIIGLGKLLLEI